MTWQGQVRRPAAQGQGRKAWICTCSPSPVATVTFRRPSWTTREPPSKEEDADRWGGGQRWEVCTTLEMQSEPVQGLWHSPRSSEQAGSQEYKCAPSFPRNKTPLHFSGVTEGWPWKGPGGERGSGPARPHRSPTHGASEQPLVVRAAVLGEAACGVRPWEQVLLLRSVIRGCLQPSVPGNLSRLTL